MQIRRTEQDQPRRRDNEVLAGLPREGLPADDHLLTHTGIKSYTSEGCTRAEREDLSHEEMIEIFGDEPFDLNPVPKYLYNNSSTPPRV